MSLQVVGGNLLPEAVTWFFTSVLRGLQVHGQHEVCNSTLSHLAMLIYENLVRLMAMISLSLFFISASCLVHFQLKKSPIFIINLPILSVKYQEITMVIIGSCFIQFTVLKSKGVQFTIIRF